MNTLLSDNFEEIETAAVRYLAPYCEEVAVLANFKLFPKLKNEEEIRLFVYRQDGVSWEGSVKASGFSSKDELFCLVDKMLETAKSRMTFDFLEQID